LETHSIIDETYVTCDINGKEYTNDAICLLNTALMDFNEVRFIQQVILKFAIVIE